MVLYRKGKQMKEAEDRLLFVKLLEKYQEKLSGRGTVLELCREDATDYARGRIQGQIDMLTKLMMELASEAEDIRR